jgi:hypothetical protein
MRAFLMAGLHGGNFESFHKVEQSPSAQSTLPVKELYEEFRQLPKAGSGDVASQLFGDLELTDSRAPKLNTDEQSTLKHLMSQYSPDLTGDARQSLQQALTAAITGDMDSLKTMVPYAPNMMALEAEEPFKKAMASIGYKVEIGGGAERTPFGERHGGMIISRVGQSETIQLSYHRADGPLAQDQFKVEVLPKPPAFLQR